MYSEHLETREIPLKLDGNPGLALEGWSNIYAESKLGVWVGQGRRRQGEEEWLSLLQTQLLHLW